MRWLIVLIVVLALGAGGYFFAAHMSGGALPTLGLVMGGERGEARQVVLRFWEDIKFDDPKSATELMMADAKEVVIVDNFLSQVFQIPQAVLDIVSYSVLTVEIDSTGNRARVKSSITVNNLKEKKPHTTETMLFLRKVGKDWLIDLKSSF